MDDLGNKGVTLIEIVLTAAISMTVILAVTIFLNTGNKSYHEAKKELNLQAEAQILMNQLCDRILEANQIDNYNESDRTCIFYQVDEDTKQIMDEKMIWYDGVSKLYYFTGKQEIGKLKPEEKNLLAQHVKSIDIKRDGSLVTVSLVLNQGTREYQVEDKIRLRNKLVEYVD